ncbi:MULTISPECIES: MarR family winged helix-turn-helix transcriptional regulator [unclassified Kribbella]|uniref:MarR family winged helix-turn-helix transcriptional regulator n=1 Tax=unclassified Kribbella TaxID=2644121 RepID=UPI003078124F
MTKQPSRVDRWADLADLALIISRELQYRGYTDERAIGLTQSEGMVMRHLLDTESAATPSQTDPSQSGRGQTAPSQVAPSQIAAATGLQRTNLSTTLRGLESKGLIERQANPADGRGVTVSPTDLGRANYVRVRREWATAVRQAAADDATHLEAALSLLTAVKEGLVEARPQVPSRHPPA